MAYLVFLLLGIIPAMIASKKGRDAGGWWLYGVLLFPIAVVHALLADNRLLHPCPHCAEPIRREALICPHCRSELPPGTTREHPQVTAPRGGAIFLVIALLLAVVAIIGGASSGIHNDAPKTQAVEEHPSAQTDPEEARKAAWHRAHPDPGAVSLCPPPYKMTARDGCQ